MRFLDALDFEFVCSQWWLKGRPVCKSENIISEGFAYWTLRERRVREKRKKREGRARQERDRENSEDKRRAVQRREEKRREGKRSEQKNRVRDQTEREDKGKRRMDEQQEGEDRVGFLDALDFDLFIARSGDPFATQKHGK